MRASLILFAITCLYCSPAQSVEYYAVTGTISDSGGQLRGMWVQNPQQVCQPFLPSTGVNKSIIVERINNYGKCGEAPTTKIMTR